MHLPLDERGRVQGAVYMDATALNVLSGRRW